MFNVMFSLFIVEIIIVCETGVFQCGCVSSTILNQSRSKLLKQILKLSPLLLY